MEGRWPGAQAPLSTCPALPCRNPQTADFLKGFGLGMVADQLADLRLGELLDTPPPGLDEAVAISKVWGMGPGGGRGRKM
jgi:hypothetical protein